MNNTQETNNKVARKPMTNKTPNEKKIDSILKKYDTKFDYGDILQAIESLIREYEYLKETYVRVRLNDKIGLVPAVVSMPSVVWFNHLFNDDYFAYYLRQAEYYKEQLQDFYKAVLFLDSNFYIDGTWTLKKAKLLKTILEDKELNAMCLEIFDKESWELVRESSYYYEDDVWEFVKKNKLLPYMRREQNA